MRADEHWSRFETPSEIHIQYITAYTKASRGKSIGVGPDNKDYAASWHEVCAAHGTIAAHTLTHHTQV